MKKKQQLSFYFWTVFIFGLISLFAVYPLANGDEGYHLSKSYLMFSSEKPEAMSESYLRGMELTAISRPKDISVWQFYKEKLEGVKKDGIISHLLTDQNFTLWIDIGHIVPALGVLLARFVYPSYGVMLIFARLFNLIFFSCGMVWILKRCKTNFFTCFMIFTVPFMQKIASPSYDVFAFLAIAAFGTNFLYLSKFRNFSELDKRDLSYSAFTILFLLLTKRNYIFALPALLGVPMFYSSLLDLFKKSKKRIRGATLVSAFLVTFFCLFTAHKLFNLKDLFRVFFDNYFNVATMGGRGLTLFSVVQDNLPDIVNICWIVCLGLLMLAEDTTSYKLGTVLGGVGAYCLNWFGIFLGFYIGHPEHLPFDDLTGRYLHAFIILLVPFMAWLGKKMQIRISDKSISRISVSATVSVLILYLLITAYRGYVLGVTPAWKN